MKPYLEPNPLLAFFIEWGGLVLVLALVLSPFAIILLRRFRPTRWKHIILAYVSSFVMFALVFFVISKIDKWLLSNFINTAWIQQPLRNILFRETLVLLLVYPLSTFYSVKLLYNKFTKKRFFISLAIAFLFFVTLVTILTYFVVWGLGHIGRTYF